MTAPHALRGLVHEEVRAAVQRSVKSGLESSNTFISVEVTEVSPSESMLRIKTRNQGTHYFTVKVTEKW